MLVRRLPNPYRSWGKLNSKTPRAVRFTGSITSSFLIALAQKQIGILPDELYVRPTCISLDIERVFATIRHSYLSEATSLCPLSDSLVILDPNSVANSQHCIQFHGHKCVTYRARELQTRSLSVRTAWPIYSYLGYLCFLLIHKSHRSTDGSWTLLHLQFAR